MVGKMETLEAAEGNTKTSANRVNQCKRWCFTYNNWDQVGLDKCLKVFGENGDYIIGKEIGDSGTKHLQGYIELKKAMRWTEFGLPKEIHWEKCKGDRAANVSYCSKDNDFVYKGLGITKPVKVLSDDKLYDWQKDIVRIIKSEPDDRTIHWYWEKTGKAGKSTFTKYLAIKFGAVPIEGRKNDILYAAAMFESDIYIMDLERTMEDYVSYGAIEKIKNGCYLCAKYESKPVVRNNPHVIVFANFAPDLSALSVDRWHIVEITPDVAKDVVDDNTLVFD